VKLFHTSTPADNMILPNKNIQFLDPRRCLMKSDTGARSVGCRRK